MIKKKLNAKIISLKLLFLKWHSFFNGLAFLWDICSNFICIIPKRVFKNSFEKSGLGSCDKITNIPPERISPH